MESCFKKINNLNSREFYEKLIENLDNLFDVNIKNIKDIVTIILELFFKSFLKIKEFKKDKLEKSFNSIEQDNKRNRVLKDWKRRVILNKCRQYEKKSNKKYISHNSGLSLVSAIQVFK